MPLTLKTRMLLTSAWKPSSGLPKDQDWTRTRTNQDWKFPGPDWTGPHQFQSSLLGFSILKDQSWSWSCQKKTKDRTGPVLFCAPQVLSRTSRNWLYSKWFQPIPIGI